MQFTKSTIALVASLMASEAYGLPAALTAKACGTTPAGGEPHQPLSRPNADTANACQEACTKDASCKSFTFGLPPQSSVPDCKLFNVPGAQVPKQDSNAMVFDVACSNTPTDKPTQANPIGGVHKARGEVLKPSPLVGNPQEPKPQEPKPQETQPAVPKPDGPRARGEPVPPPPAATGPQDPKPLDTQPPHIEPESPKPRGEPTAPPPPAIKPQQTKPAQPKLQGPRARGEAILPPPPASRPLEPKAKQTPPPLPKLDGPKPRGEPVPPPLPPAMKPQETKPAQPKLEGPKVRGEPVPPPPPASRPQEPKAKQTPPPLPKPEGPKARGEAKMCGAAPAGQAGRAPQPIKLDASVATADACLALGKATKGCFAVQFSQPIEGGAPQCSLFDLSANVLPPKDGAKFDLVFDIGC